MSLLEAHPLVVVTGISASGKSTVADLLARRFDRGVHVKGDVFRRMVVSGRQEMSATPTDEAGRQLRLRYQLGAFTADAYHRAGFSMVLQDVIIGTVLKEYLTAISSRPWWSWPSVPALTLSLPVELRDKTAYASGLSEVQEWDALFRRETPRLGMWIDNSDSSPPARSGDSRKDSNSAESE